MFPIRHFESQQKSPGGRNWVNALRKIDSAPISLCLLPEHACLCNMYIHMYNLDTIFRNIFECIRELRLEQLYGTNLPSCDHQMTERKKDSCSTSTPQTFNLLALVSLTLVAPVALRNDRWRILSEFSIIILARFFSRFGVDFYDTNDTNSKSNGLFFYLTLPYLTVSNCMRVFEGKCLLWNIFQSALYRNCNDIPFSVVYSIHRRWFSPSCMRKSLAWEGEEIVSDTSTISSHGWIDIDF